MNEGAKQKEKAKLQRQVGWELRKVNSWEGLQQRKRAAVEEFPEPERIQMRAMSTTSGMSTPSRADKADMLQTVWESSGKLCSAWIQFRSKLFFNMSFKYEPEKIEDLETDWTVLKKNRCKSLGPIRV